MGINEQLLVSIGLPVFNGEKGLNSAINSLLEQDYSNFEIIISDNGSTDSTPKICKTFVEKDRRIKYFRSEENRGAIWNFNRVFELSSGEYFMWAADDDLRDERFVSSCVKKLEMNKGAVLCSPNIKAFVEGSDRLIYVASLDTFSAQINLVDRYKETINNFPMLAIYGVYRSSAVKQTKVMQYGVIAADMCFIRELSLFGTFVQVSDVFFYYHMRKIWHNVSQDYQAFFGGKKKPWWYLPFVIVLWTNTKDILSLNIDLANKIRLSSVLYYTEIKRLSVRLMIKVLSVVLSRNIKNKMELLIYNKFLEKRNIIVHDDELYLERIVKPQLRW